MRLCPDRHGGGPKRVVVPPAAVGGTGTRVRGRPTSPVRVEREGPGRLVLARCRGRGPSSPVDNDRPLAASEQAAGPKVNSGPGTPGRRQLLTLGECQPLPGGKSRRITGQHLTSLGDRHIAGPAD
jgi:hypothetical protein